MPVLLFPSGREHHRYATAHVVSSLLFPRFHHGSAPRARWRLSHLLSCPALRGSRSAKGTRLSVSRCPCASHDVNYKRLCVAWLPWAVERTCSLELEGHE